MRKNAAYSHPKPDMSIQPDGGRLKQSEIDQLNAFASFTDAVDDLPPGHRITISKRRDGSISVDGHWDSSSKLDLAIRLGRGAE